MDTTGVTVVERPDLEEPALLVMLAGWIDAGGAAAAAMALIEQEAAARTIAVFDSDLFIDYRARRPVMELREGISTRLVWPTIELKAGKDLAGRDVLLLTGHEPDSQWRRFGELVAGLAVDLGARLMVGMGAYPFTMPHSRPARISCTTPSVELARTVPYLRNSVDVPAGVAAVLEQAFHAREVPAIGLWVQVPHYVATMPYPAASAALIDAVADTARLRFDTSAVRQEAVLHRTRLDQLVATNPEHVTMVEQLEQAYDSLDAEGALGATGPSQHPSSLPDSPLDAGSLPSGDELAAELEQYLRDQDG